MTNSINCLFQDRHDNPNWREQGISDITLMETFIIEKAIFTIFQKAEVNSTNILGNLDVQNTGCITMALFITFINLTKI